MPEREGGGGKRGRGERGGGTQQRMSPPLAAPLLALARWDMAHDIAPVRQAARRRPKFPPHRSRRCLECTPSRAPSSSLGVDRVPLPLALAVSRIHLVAPAAARLNRQQHKERTLLAPSRPPTPSPPLPPLHHRHRRSSPPPPPASSPPPPTAWFASASAAACLSRTRESATGGRERE